MEKPTLPSIQFLLQETSAPPPPSPQPQQHKRHGRHGYSKSLSTLPEDLASMSLQGPWQGNPLTNEEERPSWMLPVDHLQQQQRQQQMTQLQASHPLPPLPPPPTTTMTQERQSHAGHGRSRSDFSLPPLLAAPTVNRHHRRAASANSMVDMMPPSPPQQPMDVEGRYTCPFCSKKFSRPSSLKIHTYSHTGEKPFACPEPGCNRHFSVQSNMRRHLKIHRNRMDEEL